MDQGSELENDVQSYHSCMQHFVLTCSVILPNTINIFVTAAELCSENELKNMDKGK